MKQIWPNYSYSPTTNVLTLTGLNIDRDQLLLVTAADRGRIMYNFADSTTTASAFTAGANTGLTLVASTAGLTTTAALVIYYDDQVGGISGTVTVGNSVNINSLPSIRINPNYNGQDGNNGPVVEADGLVGNDPRYMVLAGGLDSVDGEFRTLAFTTGGLAVAGTVTIGNTVTIAGTVTANPTGTQTIAGSVTISAGTAQIGSVTASLAISSTAITSGSFTSLTSATLVPGNVARKMATVFNQGAGQLFVNAGATATTLGGGFMVALSSGDYFECGFTTTTLSAIYATAGTCSWMSH